jgi:hypothetical protein
MDAFGKVIVVVYAWLGEEIRIISARKATARERKQYGGHYEKRVRFQQGQARGDRKVVPW